MIAVALGCVAVLLGIACLGVATSRWRLASSFVYGGCLLVSIIGLGDGLSGLLAPAVPPPSMTLPLGLPWVGTHFRLDALSAFFLAVVNFGAAVASLYALGYGRHEESPQRVLPFYAAFLAGMNLVVLADDAFTFLVSWEFMSLSSCALVIAHHRDPENIRAGYIYLVMASIGTLALLLAFGALAGADGGYAFDAIRAGTPSAPVTGFVFCLALFGAGSKAGLVPLHVWLPLAHPAAPSQVSALMSGVMTKVAVYGFVRIAFDLLGAPVWWWGIGAHDRQRHGRYRHPLRDAAKRCEETPRLQHGREHRFCVCRPWSRAGLQGERHAERGCARRDRGAVSRFQSRDIQELALLQRGRRAQRDWRAQH
jgi:hydrogenase-4 component B